MLMKTGAPRSVTLILCTGADQVLAGTRGCAPNKWSNAPNHSHFQTCSTGQFLILLQTVAKVILASGARREEETWNSYTG